MSLWRQLHGLASRARLTLSPRATTLQGGQHPATRFSSAPFLSGDTFRSLASIVLDEQIDFGRDPSSPAIVFSTAEQITQRDFLKRLHLHKGLESKFPSLILHNSDRVISPEQVDFLSQYFEKVWAVNVLQETTFLHALPIGLENAHLNKNGRLDHYFNQLACPAPIADRKRLVFSNFHQETNPPIRADVADLMTKSRHGHQAKFMKLGEYRRTVQGSKFVISPPGNGPDCHRTWEAIYLGAIPVVLSRFLAPSFTKNLPILSVSEYEEFCDMSDSELEKTYATLKQKSLRMAWFNYWFHRIEGDHSVRTEEA